MDSDEAGPSNVRVMTRKEFLNIMQQQNLPNINHRLNFLENYLFNTDNFDDDEIKNLKHNFSQFKSQFKSKWIEAHYMLDKFVKNNKEWLEGTVEISRKINRPGRPAKAFTESCDRSKRRKSESLRSSTDVEVLTNATQIKLETSGKRDAAHVLKALTCSPMRATKYKKAYLRTQQTEKKTQINCFFHGPIVIEKALLPIGHLSEEAAEAWNKHFRLFRQNLSRKFSRISCNRDVLNRLLLSSDPVLTGMRPTIRKKSKLFLKETLEMLLPMESSEARDPEDSDYEETDYDSELSSD